MQLLAYINKKVFDKDDLDIERNSTTDWQRSIKFFQENL